jgi:hypothetical protein
MTHRHLSDDRLVEIGLTDTPSSHEQQHLGACGACETRRAGIAHMLEELAVASREDADAAFPADRLARQQLRILQRVEHEGRPARVIAFPAAPHETPAGVIARTRPASRWIAAAAVAGLLVGVLAGRMGEQGRALGAPERVTARSVAPAAGIRTVGTTISDEELLGQIERASEGRGGASLRALDDLTPRAWDVR